MEVQGLPRPVRRRRMEECLAGTAAERVLYEAVGVHACERARAILRLTANEYRSQICIRGTTYLGMNRECKRPVATRVRHQLILRDGRNMFQRSHHTMQTNAALALDGHALVRRRVVSVDLSLDYARHG